MSGNNGAGGLDTVTTLNTIADSSNSWNYDALGNQTSTQNGNQTRTFNAQNQIASITGQTATPVYDNNGNLTTDQNGVTYHYDAWNRMVFSSAGPNGDEVLRYDALGRSLLSWFDGNTANTYYSQDWQPIEDDLSPTSIHTYAWGARGIDDLIARDQTGFSRIYVQQDANDNVTAIGGSSVTERFVYDAYGLVTVLSNTWATTTDTHLWTILYQGARYDTYSNFYIMRNRIYDPVTGTWMQQDPAGYIDGPNTYQFVDSQPIHAVDPSGLALYAFDGTWNWPGQKKADGTREDATNVQRFAAMYQGPVTYERGIGNSHDFDLLGQLCNGLTGSGGDTFLDSAYSRLIQLYNEGVQTGNDSEKTIDVIGFSRGAALARIFVNMVNTKGIPDLSSAQAVTIGYNDLKGRWTTKTSIRYCRWWKPRVRFLGVFDTVASFGLPLNYSGSPLPTFDFVPLGIPANVDTAAQIMRNPDGRIGFQSVPINRGMEASVNGSHWYVGTSDTTLDWMVTQAHLAGVPISNRAVNEETPIV